MEFKINKIDSDIIERFDRDLSTERIHELKKDENIRKLKDDEHNKNEHKRRKEKKKEKITIEAVKCGNLTVSVQAEKLDTINEENSKGKHLDTKK